MQGDGQDMPAGGERAGDRKACGHRLDGSVQDRDGGKRVGIFRALGHIGAGDFLAVEIDDRAVVPRQVKQQPCEGLGGRERVAEVGAVAGALWGTTETGSP